MQIKTTALVLKPRNVGENDKILVLLTEEYGVIEATARGAQRSKNAYSTFCQPFCYAKIELFKGKNSWLVNTVQVLDSHFPLSADPFAAALSAYFCEVVRVLSPGEEAAKQYMQLLLNLFWLFEQGKRDARQLKAIFELRVLVYAGFAPNLVGCTECGKFESDLMYFLPAKACLLCEDCIHASEQNSLWHFLVPKAVLNAMRYIVYGDAHKIFSFSLKDPSLSILGNITEAYLLYCTDTKFLSLQVYHALMEPLTNKDSDLRKDIDE